MVSKKRGDIIAASAALQLFDYEGQQEHHRDEEEDCALDGHSPSA
jgi:hypothetical protein